MAYASGTSWSWPKENLGATIHESPLPGAFVDDELPSEAPEVPKAQNGAQTNPSPKPQRYYGPRTCRICLEVVLPTFETPTADLTGMFSPTPSVTYISQDPESGRLIRPCKCKGSQRYVHEGCIQEWRHADPAYGRRNYWECPTCHFRYRLERMRWSRWIRSKLAQIFLTLLILFTAVFLLGFVADPIINLYLDPMGTLILNPLSSSVPLYDDEPPTWSDHILKGVASLGLLSFVKAFVAVGPWQWYNLRNSGFLSGRTRNGRGGTGRDRLENISWVLVLIGLITVLIGLITFLYAVWKGVRAWSRRVLEKAGERVADVQGDDDDDGVDESPLPNGANTGSAAH